MAPILRQVGMSGQLNFIHAAAVLAATLERLHVRYQDAAAVTSAPPTDSRNAGTPSGRWRATLRLS